MSGVHGGGVDAAWAIAMHGVSLRYGGVTALDAVDLRVPEGAVCVLAGTNGAGKSSLMKVLMNLERPQQGRADVFALDTAASGADVRAQIGYIPESHLHDHGWASCARLIRHVAVHYPTWDHAYAAQLVDALGVPVQRRVGALSKGEQRRLQFVLALAHRPPLLLLDEPTDGLDPVVRNRVLAQLAQHLADTPTTVLIATHHLGEIGSLADQLGVLRGGRLIAQMTRDALRDAVLRYRVDVPAGWQPPPGLRMVAPRYSRTGRELQATLVGPQDASTAQLVASGAAVREVSALSMEEAALALLAEEETP